jgi:hypothetical protein
MRTSRPCGITLHSISTMGLAVVSLILATSCTDKSTRLSLPESEAIADPSIQGLDPLVKDTRVFQKQAAYKIFVGGAPLGTAVASYGFFGSQSKEVEIKLLHRLGASALLTQMTLKNDGQTDSKWTEIFKTSQSDDSLVNTFADFSKALGLSNLGEITNSEVFQKQLEKLFVENTEEVFAKDLEVNWIGKMPLQFLKTEKSALEEFSEKELKKPTELAWFSNPASLTSDSKHLLQDSENCMIFAKDAENQVIREFPQLPYLMHRKIYNLSSLCTRLAVMLSKSEASKNIEQTLGDIHGLFRSLREEDPAEIPSELLNHTESQAMLNPAQKWAWLKTASLLIKTACSELSNIIAFERSQKIDLSMKVSLDQLTPGSILKGVLRAKDVRFKTEVKVALDGKQSPSQWASFQNLLAQPIKLAASSQASAALPPFKETKDETYVSGQAFAKGEVNSLQVLCEAHNGRVGLDLGDAPASLIYGPNGRGVWDRPFRLGLVAEFAKRAGVSSSCRTVTFSVPKEMQNDIEIEIKSFQRNILQSESEFQVTNRNAKRMRVLPGVYELTLSSLVSAEILAVQNILVPEGNRKMAVNVHIPMSAKGR